MSKNKDQSDNIRITLKLINQRIYIQYIYIQYSKIQNKKTTVTHTYKQMQDQIIKQITLLQESMSSFKQSTNYETLSYHQYNNQNIIKNYNKYTEVLRKIHEANPKKNKVVQKLINENNNFINSLLTYSQEIQTFLQLSLKKNQGEQNLVISHTNYQSQAILLAYYLKRRGYNIRVLSSQEQIKKGWTRSLVPLNQVDQVMEFNCIVKLQKIGLQYFQQNEPYVENQSKQELITIIDIFDLHPTVYRPYIFSELHADHRVILYTSSVQQNQITNLLKDRPTTPTFEFLELSQKYPCQFIGKNSLQEQMTSFLEQQSAHPQKQDIIIFHDPTQSFINQISHKIKKLKSNIIKNVHYVTGPNQSLKLAPVQLKQATSSILVKSSISVVSSTSQGANLSSNSVIHTHNNIFIAPNSQTLKSWNYDLSNVFYVFDYRKDQTYHYSYETMTYVNTKYQYITQRQMSLRLNFVGMNKIGRYCYQLAKQTKDNIDNQFWYLEDRKILDLGRYVLAMLKDRGNYVYFEKQVKGCKIMKRVLDALCYAKIIGKDGNQYKILRNDVAEAMNKLEDVNPLALANIIDFKNNQYKNSEEMENKGKQFYAKMTQLLSVAISVLMSQESLRQRPAKSNNVTDRPTKLWRQTGYLHSCIDAVVRSKIIDYRTNNMTMNPMKSKASRRITSQKISQINSCEYDMFGTLFQNIQAHRITFDEMTQQDFIREQLINQTALHKVIDQADKICQVLELPEYDFTHFQEINDVMQGLLKSQDRGYGVFSGSRRIGYMVKGCNKGIFPSKTSLISLLNQRPSFVFITRLNENIQFEGQSRLQIAFCNHISETLFMSIFGMLPPSKSSSFGQTQLQFHGLSSATFSQLWRNNGQDIQSFQKEWDCFIEPNEQVAMISIHCPKEKQKKIQQEFNKFIEKIKQKIIADTKITNYFNSTSVVLGSGGAIQQIIKDKYINKCLLDNLSLDIDESDLYELFQEFFTLKDIKIQDPDLENNKKSYFKSAIIQFVSQKDYYRFYQYYNECLYMDRRMRVTPIESKSESDTLGSEMYIEFTWQAWKSQCQGVVEFETQEAVTKCIQTMKDKNLDKQKVQMTQKGTKVFLDNMNKFTDEKTLQRALENFGKILNIQILKTPCKQPPKQQQHVSAQIKKLFDDQIDFQVKNVQKQKNGVRKCKAVFNDINHINKILTQMDRKTGYLGVGRAQLSSWFTHPVIVAHGYLSLYEELVNYAYSKMPQNNMIQVQHKVFHNNQYILTKSTKKEEIDIFKAKINEQLAGNPVQLTSLQKNIVLSEVGIQNLLQIQQKYNCKLLPDFKDKHLQVMCLLSNAKRIKQQIKAKIQDQFFYRIPLNQKSYKYFKQNQDEYKCMKQQYFLTELELEQVGKNILLQGKANNVQNAFSYLMHKIQSVSKSMQEMVNADCCGICCQQPFRPYRLQRCGHKFCMHCLEQTIISTLGDISMFPIKCPQCLAELVIQDLNSLLNNQTWPKLISMAVNHYIGRNPELVSNCYTAGCKQINFLMIDHFKCDGCNQSYCLQCKLNYHPGMTCQQAKQGGSAAFQKYMKQNNIRRCPNDKCKMPIFRVDGCYRVTCSRCNKSMCFKCQPEKMIAYDNYNDCYKHLNDVHGSYW